ncbi:MAG: helix-turn-helix transcriptional regulator [Bacteroidaceae bacterium]|nr:helix-turn-helix transcriptional regulator [Bacteroidaceae bacterium]
MSHDHIRHIDLAEIRQSLPTERGNIARERFALVMDSTPILAQRMFHQPMRLKEWRMLHVLEGHADYIINLLPQRIHAGQFIFLPRECLVEVASVSTDFALHVLAVGESNELPIELSALPTQPFILPLTADDDRLCATYFALLADLLSQPELSDMAVFHLAQSLLSQMYTRSRQTIAQTATPHLTSAERLAQQFVALLYEHGTRERSIPFYAERLHVTPNHLSNVIRRQTGETVMQWLARTTITEAKVLLRHSDLRIYEIAQRLNFLEPTAFNRYFKAQTGQTPLAYRQTT